MTARRIPKAKIISSPAGFAQLAGDSHGDVRLVNGRVIGPTLADPGMDARVKAAQLRMFPDRKAAIEHFRRRGVLTRAGELTKAFGG